MHVLQKLQVFVKQISIFPIIILLFKVVEDIVQLGYG